jgi:hypothetical protein
MRALLLLIAAAGLRVAADAPKPAKKAKKPPEEYAKVELRGGFRMGSNDLLPNGNRGPRIASTAVIINGCECELDFSKHPELLKDKEALEKSKQVIVTGRLELPGPGVRQSTRGGKLGNTPLVIVETLKIVNE